jgi:tetratricopeptide (TPR) repeat protein
MTALVGRALRRAGEPLAILAIAAAALALGAREIRTPDAYFHLEVGREIVRDRAPPREQRWLAFHRDRAFVDPEWGFQAAEALAARGAGLDGVLALRLGLVFVATGAVYAAARRASGLAAALAALGFLLVGEGRFLDAPEMASIALAALFVAILEAREAAPRAVFVLPLLVLLWANLHGFFPIGIALTACYAAGDLLHGRRVRLLFVLALALAAPLANPYGLEGALYPLRIAADGARRALLAEQVIELRSPLFDPALSTTWQARVFQGGLAAAALAAIASAARGFRLERVLGIGLAVALSAPYVRNVGLFAAIAAPLAALAAAGPLGRLAARPPLARHVGRTGLLLHAAAALAAVAVAWSVGSGRWDRDSLDDVGLGPRFAPAISHDAAIEFYLAHDLPPVLWNDFGTGHALVAQSGGRLRPAISGQTDLYPLELLRAYGDAVAGRGGVAALLARYPADAIFLDHRRLAGSDLLAELLESREWALVYLDARDAIWLRKAGATREAAGRLRLDLAAIARDPERAAAFAEDRADREGPLLGALRAAGLLAAPPRVPRDRLGLAALLLAAGETEGAARLAARAAEIRPGWPPCDYLLGEIAREKGDLDEAKARFRAAARALPGNAALRHALGLLHLRLQEYGRAEEELEAALAAEPANPVYRENLRLLYALEGKKDRAAALGEGAQAAAGAGGGPASAEARRALAVRRFNEAVACAGEGRPREAERRYREAIALDPGFADAHYNLGNLLFRDGRKEEALLLYRRAAELAPADAEARYNVGIVLRDLGRPDEARRALEEALGLEPRHARARAALAELGRAASGGAEKR